MLSAHSTMNIWAIRPDLLLLHSQTDAIELYAQLFFWTMVALPKAQLVLAKPKLLKI